MAILSCQYGGAAGSAVKILLMRGRGRLAGGAIRAASRPFKYLLVGNNHAARIFGNDTHGHATLL